MGDKIDKYRCLLRCCFDFKDGEELDVNLDSLIEMMEEDRLGLVVEVVDGIVLVVSVGVELMDFSVGV